MPPPLGSPSVGHRPELSTGKLRTGAASRPSLGGFGQATPQQHGIRRISRRLNLSLVSSIHKPCQGAPETEAKRINEPRHDADWRSDVELPVPAQGGPLDFLLAQEEVECYGNRIGALAQLFRQIALADYYVASWIPLVDIAPIGRNLVGECPEFPLVSSLCAVISNLIGFQTPSARSCNSDKTSDHCAALPV